MKNFAFILICFGLSAQNMVHCELENDLPNASEVIAASQGQNNEGPFANSIEAIDIATTSTNQDYSSGIDKVTLSPSTNVITQLATSKTIVQSKQQLENGIDENSAIRTTVESTHEEGLPTTVAATTHEEKLPTTLAAKTHEESLPTTLAATTHEEKLPTTLAATTQSKEEQNLTSTVSSTIAVETTMQPQKQSKTLKHSTVHVQTEMEIEVTTTPTTDVPRTTASLSTTPAAYYMKCKNRLPQRKCEQLKKLYRRFNACQRLPTMRKYCKQSCGLCGKLQTIQRIAKKYCKDFSRILCPRFSSFCEEKSSNGRYMRKFCKKTCNGC